MVQTPYAPVTANVHAALQRIGGRDALVRAWLHVDDAGALAAAKVLDQSEPGPLHGVCVGVKDVIAVAGMPLTHNSPLFSGHVPSEDAPCVATLRAAGAVIIGKTDTTEFAAAGRNAASANPHDPARTPGGSSAGSAAAVADGHVPLALATQTGGSTIRPASFCGIHGFKPSWGLVSREGVKTYANSLDTVGWYARDLDMIDRVCDVYGLASAERVDSSRLRIGVFRTPWWDEMTPDGQAAFDSVSAAMARAGIETVEIAGLDALLAPSAPGIAPLGRSPGEPRFNQPWTLLHAPVINLPLARGDGGMPIGVSLVAPRYDDRRLIAVAREVELRLAAASI